MLFNSYEFIFFFLPFTFFVYFFLTRKKTAVTANAFLVFASLFFYSWWNIAYLPIIAGSMLFNYAMGRALTSMSMNSGGLKRKKQLKNALLTFGIITNLALLGYYKYADFFISNTNYIFDTNLPLLHLVLPLAISFFTFQQCAYLVDSYRGETHEHHFLNYAVFVSFFPQLIAGPIVHHREMMPQFASFDNKAINYKHIALGLFIFSIGLFKKVVLADSFAAWANIGFDKMDTLSMVQAWATSLAYSFQIYFDFSGYTDMAIGAALLFNIKLPFNFNSPYKALNIQDFWRRWHMTLSRFLRDYVYIPLGGNRLGSMRTYSNIMITFVIGGLWHGASWTFVLWGALHGSALVIQRLWQCTQIRIPPALAWFITFNFINLSWVFFRAKDFDDAFKVLRGLCGMNEIGHLSSLTLFTGETIDGLFIILLFILASILLCLKNSNELQTGLSISRRHMIFAGLLFTCSVLSFNKISAFLYFNF